METYVLDEHGEPVAEPDTLKWGAWFQTGNRSLARWVKDDVTVSTVFLGLNHAMGAEPEPVLWETMIFGGKHDGWMRRYSSRKDALKGHNKAVKMARG